MHTSEKLRAQRHKLGLTQAEVGRRAKMSTVQYNGYETRRHEPSEKTMERIARVLKVNADSLWGDEWTEDGEQSVEDLKESLRKRVADINNCKPDRVRVIIQLD